MIWSTKRALAASLPLFIAYACQPLSEIPDDRCGNRVVEPERNEDCDEISDRCYPPGDPKECRFRCAETVDCPTGHACGLDGICRQPQGSLTLAYDARDETDGLEIADFDADGRLDLLQSSTDNVQVHHLSPQLTPVFTQTIGRSSGERPRAIDLDGLGGVDLVVPTPIGLGGANGLGIYLSASGRSFTPASFASFPLPAKAVRGTIADGIFPASEKEILAVSEIAPELGGGVGLFGLSTRSAQDAKIAAPSLPHPDDVVGLSSIRREPYGCEWLVVAEAGASELMLIRPCELDAENLYGWSVDAPDDDTIPIAGATVLDPDTFGEDAEVFEPFAGVEAVFTGDFDGNGLEDVAVTVFTEPAGSVAIHVSYQTRVHETNPGRGFHSQPPPAQLPSGAQPDLVLDGTTSLLEVKGGSSCNALGLPLAVADVNGDGKPDVAYSRATAVSLVGPFYDIRCDQSWRRAAVGDLDGSGTLDFVGVRAADGHPTTGIEVLLSAEDGVLTRYLVATESPAEFLVVDNFDGDQADDFVFVERTVAGEPQPFFAVFGQATGGFPAAKPLGSLPNVVQIVAGRSSGADAAAEVVAVSALGGIDGDGLVDAAGAVLIGSSAREILAPYTVSFDVVTSTMPVTIDRTVTRTFEIVPGHFGAPGLALLTLDGSFDGATGTVRPARLVFAPFASETLLGAHLAGIYDPGGDNQQLDCQECFIAAIDGPDGDRLWSFGGEGVSHHPATSEGFGAAEALAIPSGWGDDVCESNGQALPAFDFGEQSRDRDPPVVGDVDADGHLDVLVFAKRCDAGVPIREAVVFFNDGAGELSFDRTMRITGTPTCQAESAALMQLDGEASREVVVAFDAPQGAADGNPCERSLLRFPSAVGASWSFADGLALSTEPLPIPYRPELMVAGDLDGDGVEDLAVGGFNGLAIYRGLAVRP